ncbi:alpha/beta hydrolase [Microbacterium sp. p3-SID338]|uniref:alpha/beta fold hydrolase n=1 Tax=unclassified Microbacterium TaxID=2609290 RepID=UPI000C80D184|nr:MULTISPECIES: alpha/beta hydrolase [unclassified Microbacterium]MCT1395910.1 alpha/beta hydrolase [Microbacterium sp. p3-SID338]PMC07059.1 alpha/beta hydrolase [Microbacterium sp. UMB0228]
MSAPRRHTVTVPGAAVSVLEWCPSGETQTPVLLLHGGGADSAELSWGQVGSALAAAGHRVLAPDHPGFGRSPRLDAPLTQERLVQYVGDLVDALGLHAYAIGGLSMGAGMALGHLLDRPDGAHAAALLGSYGLMPRLTDGAVGTLSHLSTFLILRSGLLGAMTRVYARDRKAMTRGLQDLVRSPDARTPGLVDAVLAEAATGSGLTTFGDWQRDQVRPLRLRTDYRDRLAEIRVPVLLVHGDRDSGVPLRRVEEAAEILPDGQLLVAPGAGHWVQRDRPDLVIPALRDWFARGSDA